MKITSKPITDDWYVSSLNFLDEVKKQYDMAPEIILADCTLRDGEQQAGVVFTKEDKLVIAKQLDKLGVHEIEVGMPSVSQEDTEAAQAIVSLGLKSRITALARAMEKDIDLVAGIGAWGVIISLPIGDLQRKFKLKWDDQRYIDTLMRITEYAKNKGIHVTLSPYDTTRVDLDFLDKVLEKVRESGFVDRMRVVDTVGATNPASIKYYIKRIKGTLKHIPVEIHCHDDFGLAIANTISAVEAGANVISSTMNGIGERSGNAATEEIALALKVLYGVDLGLDLSVLKETSELVEKLSGVRLQQHKSVVGKNCFAHETGMTVAGLLNMKYTSEAYNPDIVGQKRRIVIGKKSGKAALEYKLKELGCNLSDEALSSILPKVKEFAVEQKRNLTDDEITSIAKEYSEQK